MRYEDLDPETRRWMLEEFKAEEARGPYRSPSLSPEGRRRFPEIMERAIISGDEDSLAKELGPLELWAEFEPVEEGGVRRTVPERAARTLARQEFNTWYVRGVCRRVMEEGDEYVQIYLAGERELQPDECSGFENTVLEVRHLYNGHRAKYWPRPNPKAFSVPCGPHCQHSVRRIPADMKAMLELEDQRFGAAFRRA